MRSEMSTGDLADIDDAIAAYNGHVDTLVHNMRLYIGAAPLREAIATTMQRLDGSVDHKLRLLVAVAVARLAEDEPGTQVVVMDRCRRFDPVAAVVNLWAYLKRHREHRQDRRQQ